MKFSKGQIVSVNYNMNGLELLADLYSTTEKLLLANYQTLLLLENCRFNFDCQYILNKKKKNRSTSPVFILTEDGHSRPLSLFYEKIFTCA